MSADTTATAQSGSNPSIAHVAQLASWNSAMSGFAQWFWAFVAAGAFILLTHGGAGYQQSKPAVFLGLFTVAGVSVWWLIQTRLTLSIVQLNTVLLIAVLMYIPAALGMLNLGSTTGFVFLAMNVLTFLFFSQLVRRFGDHALPLICRTLLVAAVVCSVAALVLLFYPIQIAGLSFGRQGYFRLVGLFSTPNRFGEVPALGVLACAYLFATTRRRLRYALVGAALLGAALGSGSKGVLLGLGVALFMLVIFARVWKKKAFAAALALAVPVIGFLVVKYYELILLATKLDQVQEGTLDIGSGRAEIWGKGAEIFWNAPLFNQIFGHGTTAFLTLVGMDAHSTYWNLIIDAGVLTLVVLLIGVAYLAFVLLSANGHRPAMAFGFSLVVFCLVRGISMPTVLKECNFAMIGFWIGAALMLCFRPRRDVSRA